MRQALALILLAGVCGCTSVRPGAGSPASASAVAAAMPPRYVEAPSAALVFAPPAALYGPPVLLPRDERTPGAFVGFQDSTTIFSDVWMNDQQGPDGSSCLFRQAVSEKISTSYR